MLRALRRGQQGITKPQVAITLAFIVLGFLFACTVISPDRFS